MDGSLHFWEAPRPELGSTEEEWRIFQWYGNGVLMGSITPNHHWLIIHSFPSFPSFPIHFPNFHQFSMGSIKPHLNSPSKPTLSHFPWAFLTQPPSERSPGCARATEAVALPVSPQSSEKMPATLM